MSRKGSRWFLPETPDVIGMLQEQAAITVNGMEAFTAWAGGDSARAADVRAAEHDCDEVRRKLVDAVSEPWPSRPIRRPLTWPSCSPRAPSTSRPHSRPWTSGAASSPRPRLRPPTPRSSRSAIWSESIARPPVTCSKSPI